MNPFVHFCGSLSRARVDLDPFPHYFLENVFPNEYYRELLRNLPPSDVYENLYEVTDFKLDHFRHRNQRDMDERWTNRLPADLRPFWNSFSEWFLGPELAQAVLRSFSSQHVSWPEVSVEAQFIRHRAGYFLGPHSDLYTKLVVLLIYLAPDNSTEQLGTSLYRPKDPAFSCANSKHYPFEEFIRVKTAPYRQNSLLAFLRSDISFHGLEPLSKSDVATEGRDLIQYVIYDKHAREAQLRGRQIQPRAATEGRPYKKRNVVFVCRSAIGESLRSAEAIENLENVRLFVITQDSTDADQLIAAARELGNKHGTLDHIVTAQETLLEPVAKTREALNIPGMSLETVRRTLDKSLLKSTLRSAGIETPPDRVVTSIRDAVRFLSEFGFPIMLKPLRGSGALATLLIHSAAELDHALELMHPSPEHPVLAEVFLHGQELCIDTITIDNEPQLHSLCCYYPSILEALEHPDTQWRCVMPRDERYREFIDEGLAAVRALSVGNAMTHMEGFVSSDGKLLGFTDATLRPAGARIGPMLGFAYDIDPYRAWARVAVDGCFDGPWERKYAVGTIFLRGAGSGLIEQVDGIEKVNRELGALVVDAHWPQAGARKSDTYTGDGYVTLRHPDTDRVNTALDFIANTVRLVYSHPASSLEWKERFQNYRELNRPAWEAK